MIHRLENEILGKGEVSGYSFSKVFENDTHYIYEVTLIGGEPSHYEVFEIIRVPICLDFANRVYSETEFKEVYPNSKKFGISAWTYNTLENAMSRVA